MLNGGGLPAPMFLQVVNGIGFIAIAAGMWFGALLALEMISFAIRAVFGGAASLNEWNSVLYTSLSRLSAFAVIGAILWAAWVVCFYHLGVEFYAISIPIGIADHLLAAGLYIPLLARWYKLESAASKVKRRDEI